MNETKWISQTDVAKIIRKDLKKSFPDTKFSVRCHSYNMGGHINIDWTNGPTESQIKKLVGKYESKGFDGMIDLEFYYDHFMLPDGTIEMYGTEGTANSRGYYNEWKKPLPEGAVKVNISTGYLFTNRTVTDDWVLRISKLCKEHFGILEKVDAPTTTEDLGKSFDFGHEYSNWYQLAYRIHQKLDLTDAVDVVEDPDFTGGGVYEGFLVVRGDAQ